MGEAPFWGPYIKDAPFGPHRGLLTSHATNISDSLIRGSIPDISILVISFSANPPKSIDFLFDKDNYIMNEISNYITLKDYIPIGIPEISNFELKSEEIKKAKSLFYYSMLYLSIIFIAIMIDSLI